MNLISILAMIGILLLFIVMYPFLRKSEKWYKLQSENGWKILSTKGRYINKVGDIEKGNFSNAIEVKESDANRILAILNTNEL